jgi:hypothetical protein
MLASQLCDLQLARTPGSGLPRVEQSGALRHGRRAVRPPLVLSMSRSMLSSASRYSTCSAKTRRELWLTNKNVRIHPAPARRNPVANTVALRAKEPVRLSNWTATAVTTSARETSRNQKPVLQKGAKDTKVVNVRSFLSAFCAFSWLWLAEVTYGGRSLWPDVRPLPGQGCEDSAAALALFSNPPA